MGDLNDVPAAVIRIVDLKKIFRRADGGRVVAVNDVSLDIARGEMVVVLGPSGCGKTTLLRCVAGLESPSAGEVYSGDRLVSSGPKGVIIPPERRGFGMMFQSYAVWPHMTAYQNVAYPLQSKRLSKRDIKERVTRILRIVEIEHLRDEYPSQLSGGQQQRIALARSLVADPDVILFDEPLSNVDARVREELRVELLTMQRRIGFGGIYVTHDQEEAMTIADRIVVMEEGRIMQQGPPHQVYSEPESQFVARFIGTVNELIGVITSHNSADSKKSTVKCDLGEVVVDSHQFPPDAQEGSLVALVIRPEALNVTRRVGDGSGQNEWRGTLYAVMFRGDHTQLIVEVNGNHFRCRGEVGAGLKEGDQVVINVPPDKVRAVPADAAELHLADGLEEMDEGDERDGSVDYGTVTSMD